MDLQSLKEYKLDYYLSYRASSWGWATWRERWMKVDWNVKEYQKFKRNIFLSISL